MRNGLDNCARTYLAVLFRPRFSRRVSSAVAAEIASAPIRIARGIARAYSPVHRLFRGLQPILVAIDRGIFP